MQTLILVLGLQCSTRLATCNFSENELIAKFVRVSTSLKLPGIQYLLFVPVIAADKAVVPLCLASYTLQK